MPTVDPSTSLKKAPFKNIVWLKRYSRVSTPMGDLDILAIPQLLNIYKNLVDFYRARENDVIRNA